MDAAFSAIRFSPDTHAEYIEPLTKLLHESYAPLAAQGMRYLATHQPSEKTLERLLEGESYLGFYNQELVGTVTLYREKTLSTCAYYRTPKVFSFGQFAIKTAMQGKGFGSRMMDMVESRATALGAIELALDTSEHATQLIAMYAKRGYKLVSTTKWEVTNYTSVIMSKTLID